MTDVLIAGAVRTSLGKFLGGLAPFGATQLGAMVVKETLRRSGVPGIMDLGGYESYFSGRLVDYPLPQDEMNKSLKAIEGLPKPKALKKGKPI